ncbi:hypothetical protein WJ438_22675 [Streptomyces sp. GD-15H]|uniref:hypothetical protein n=1 Tax=Streptomyces sp. GD-15H TaxID=3129112 RepID=UPI003244DF8E
MSVGFTVGLIAGNAAAPAVSAWLLQTTGGWPAIAGYMAAISLLSLVAGLFLRLPATTDPQLVTDAQATEVPAEAEQVTR